MVFPLFLLATGPYPNPIALQPTFGSVKRMKKRSGLLLTSVAVYHYYYYHHHYHYY